MNKKYLIWGILLLATLLRLINLSSGDITGSDEVFYSFRAIGPLDFDNAPNQTTPLQWFDPNIPWWTHLSMHDHPLLVFLVQHVSMGIFGENNFGFRFPSAVFGILSVYLIYLIAKKLFSENTGLLAAFLTAITVNHVYISRLGLQESYVIFFLLLASYLFLKAIENPKYFIWTGVALGLAFLTKYIAFIAVPIFLTYLLLLQRNVFRKKQFWLGVLIAAAIASPIAIYNLELYSAVGHFDFQFSSIFSQHPEVWKSAPGKEEIGTLGDRVRNFIPHLASGNSWIFLTLFAIAVIYFLIIYLRRQDRELFRTKAFLDIALIWLAILLLFIGPSLRFLTLLTPFLAIKIAVFLEKIRPMLPKALLFAAILVVLWEIFYTANSLLLDYPIGPRFWLWSKVRFDNYNWGYNQLEDYLNTELAGKYPLLSFDAKYQFLQKLQDAAVISAKSRGYQPYAAMIIYTPTIQNAAQLWSLDRRQIYQGWPVVTSNGFAELINKNGLDYLTKSGIHSYYFITPTEAVPWRKNAAPSAADVQIERQLTTRGVQPAIIKNKRGEEVFRIYKFSL